jgi:hypothetical protein
MTSLEEWSVQAQDQKLMSDIEECVDCIKDIPWATAILDFVSKRIQPGRSLTYRSIID